MRWSWPARSDDGGDDAAPIALASYIQHLEEEIRWLKGQMIHERQRAERAIDTILSLQQRPVMPITIPTPAEVRDNGFPDVDSPEFSGAGRLPDD